MDFNTQWWKIQFEGNEERKSEGKLIAILNFAEQEIDRAPVNKYKRKKKLNFFSVGREIETWPNWRISQIYESYQSPSWPNSGFLITKKKKKSGEKNWVCYIKKSSTESEFISWTSPLLPAYSLQTKMLESGRGVWG